MFSAVLLYLFYIILRLESGDIPLFLLPQILQNASAAAVLTLAGGFLFEFLEELTERL